MGYLVLFLGSFAVIIVLLSIAVEVNRGELEPMSYLLGTGTMFVTPKTPSTSLRELKTSREFLRLLCIPNNVIFKNSKIKTADVWIDSYNSTEISYPPIFVRIYSLGNLVAAPDSSKDVIIWYHGGGFTRGEVTMDDALCGDLAQIANAIVISVEYRLSPEYPFPIPVMDAFHALQWTSRHIGAFGGNPDKIFVAGESAGGSLAAVVTAMNLDPKYTSPNDRAMIRGAAFVYPVTDLGVETSSYEMYATVNGLLTPASAHSFATLYCPHDNILDTCRKDYRFAPLHTPKDIISLFPPSFMVLAKYDILLEDGLQYVDRLKLAGAPVKLNVYNDSVHGFFGKKLFRSGHVALDEVAQYFLSLSQPRQ